MQDAQILTYAGKTLATWKAPKASTRLDAKGMEQAHPDLAARFMVTNQTSRRLLIKPIEQATSSQSKFNAKELT
jgi:hypothetical protein